MQNTPIANRHALLPTMAAGKNFLLAAARRCGKTKDFRVNRCTLSFLAFITFSTLSTVALAADRTIYSAPDKSVVFLGGIGYMAQ